MISADFVATYFEAWNHGDAGAVADLLGSDGTYLDIPTQQTLSGEDLLIHLREFFDQGECRYQLVGEILTGENTIAFQYQAVPEPGSTSPPWTGAEFVTFEGDAATQLMISNKEGSTLQLNMASASIASVIVHKDTTVNSHMGGRCTPV